MTCITKLDENTYEVNGKQVTQQDYKSLDTTERKFFEQYLRATKDQYIKKSVYR
jgi:hypothetical protein